MTPLNSVKSINFQNNFHLYKQIKINTPYILEPIKIDEKIKSEFFDKRYIELKTESSSKIKITHKKFIENLNFLFADISYLITIKGSVAGDLCFNKLKDNYSDLDIKIYLNQAFYDFRIVYFKIRQLLGSFSVGYGNFNEIVKINLSRPFTKEGRFINFKLANYIDLSFSKEPYETSYFSLKTSIEYDLTRNAVVYPRKEASYFRELKDRITKGDFISQNISSIDELGVLRLLSEYGEKGNCSDTTPSLLDRLSVIGNEAEVGQKIWLINTIESVLSHFKSQSKRVCYLINLMSLAYNNLNHSTEEYKTLLTVLQIKLKMHTSNRKDFINSLGKSIYKEPHKAFENLGFVLKFLPYELQNNYLHIENDYGLRLIPRELSAKNSKWWNDPLEGEKIKAKNIPDQIKTLFGYSEIINLTINFLWKSPINENFLVSKLKLLFHQIQHLNLSSNQKLIGMEKVLWLYSNFKSVDKIDYIKLSDRYIKTIISRPCIKFQVFK